MAKLEFPEWAHQELRGRHDYPGLMSDAEALLKTMGRLPDDPFQAMKEMETASLMAIAAMEPGAFRRLVPVHIKDEILRAHGNSDDIESREGKHPGYTIED